jgi:5-methyltetrahydropteroyltriglutamate--homocysteine methyltransferase
MNLNLNPLDTTVVGSFPTLPFYKVNHDFPPYTPTVPEGEPYIDDPFLPGIFRSLKLQQDAGIDYPSYGQPQDMCSMFLGSLVGHGLDNAHGFQVVDDIEIPPTIPAIEYLQVSKRYSSAKGFKMPLTGPITLAASLKVGSKAAIEYPEVVEQLARFVGFVAHAYDRGGASIISVDEPSLVYALYVGMDPELCTEMINIALKPITHAVPSIHACGQLNANTTDILLATTARILDHEFAFIPQNMTAYSRDQLESQEKLLGYGCVVSNVEPTHLIEIQKDGDWRKVVESKKTIKKRIDEAIARWGKENLILDPDCGFGGMKGYIRGLLTEDTAMRICFEKLKIMVDTKREMA